MARPSSPVARRPGSALPRRRLRLRPRLPYRGSAMRHPDEFDAFYKDARTRLLLQTYALTGDLPASRAAVRDSFVVTWHHWRKVSRLDDPEAWARPPRLGARPAPPHRPALAPRAGPRPRGGADPRRPRQAAAHPAQGAAAHPAHHAARWPRWPARSGCPARGRARAADRDRRSSRCCASVPTTSIRALFEPLRAPRRGLHVAARARSSGAPAPPGGVPTPSSARSPRRRRAGRSPARWSPTPPACGRRWLPRADRGAGRSAGTPTAGAARRSPSTAARGDAEPRAGRPARRRAAAGRATEHRATTRPATASRCPARTARYADPRGTRRPGAHLRAPRPAQGPSRTCPPSRPPRRPATPRAAGRAFDTSARLVRRMHRRRGSSCWRPRGGSTGSATRRCWSSCVTGAGRTHRSWPASPAPAG